MSDQPMIWVSDDASLAQYCAQWQHLPVLALDTEFIRTTTFFPRPALLQVSDGEACYLIDPLTLNDVAPLREVLTSGPLKILHSCSEDLEVFKGWLQLVPAPVVDTQIAAAFAGLDSGMGYQRLVDTLLDIQLDKGETRSDWLQRPLTESQQHYAAQDVAWLLPLWAKLLNRLAGQAPIAGCERLDIVMQEGESLVREARMTTDDAESYWRVRQAWRLDSRGLQVLRALCIWREERCRERDIPRSRVASDGLLQSLCEQLPESLPQLAQLEEASPGWIKQSGREVLGLIQQAQAVPRQEWPKPLPNPTAPEYKQLRKQWRERLKTLAEQHGLSPELLVRRKQMEQWIAEQLAGQPVTLPADWPQWRRLLLADVLGAPA
ncbi:ribonuclease D [Terasakiispira papahanaumokuakeensis]|nr:ribonuclease D [Terasakiispira papahanaumokuakeensis]